jgi:hypothetical protein
MKLNLLAKSVTCTGATTLISNLIRSTTISIRQVKDTGGWKGEYAYGRGQEIYTITIPRSLEGRTFSEAAQVIHWITCRITSLDHLPTF